MHFTINFSYSAYGSIYLLNVIILIDIPQCFAGNSMENVGGEENIPRFFIFPVRIIKRYNFTSHIK